MACVNSVLIKHRAPVVVFFPLHSYIIRNAKKWCKTKMAIPEDTAITAYVVSLFNISSGWALTLRNSPHSILIGVSKNHVSLHGSPLFRYHLTIRTPNGL